MAETFQPMPNDGIAKGKQAKKARRILPSPSVSTQARQVKQLSYTVAANPVRANSNRIAKGTVYVLSPDSDELFVKVSKSESIALSTGASFGTDSDAYVVTL